jgi:hypothetical protein
LQCVTKPALDEHDLVVEKAISREGLSHCLERHGKSIKRVKRVSFILREIAWIRGGQAAEGVEQNHLSAVFAAGS